MIPIAIMLTLSLVVSGKTIGNLFICLAKQIGYLNRNKLLRLEQFYQENPNEVRKLLLELQITKQKLVTSLSANRILKKQVEQAGSKHSCFCNRLRILTLYLTRNLRPEDLESLIKYSHRSISRWLTNLNRYGLIGLLPRDQLPWPVKNQTSPEIVNLVWQIYEENPTWGRWRIAQTLWKLFVFIAPCTVRNILRRPKKRP